MDRQEFLTAYTVCVVIGLAVRTAYARRPQPGDMRTDRSSVLDTALIAGTGVGMFVLPIGRVLWPGLAFADYGLPTWAGICGLGIFAAALWLLWRSHADLGRNWSAMPQVRVDHTLVTHGVYARIRHPMYAAHWLWAVAQALLVHNWIAGPAMLVLFLPTYLVRVPREEQMLLDEFGEEYSEYMARTGRVMPRLSGAPERPRS